MAITDALLPEYDHEMGTTRRVLERLPDAEFGWKPHDRSMSLGDLAQHVAGLVMWCGAIADQPEFDLATYNPEDMPKMDTRDALLAAFDAGVAAGRKTLAAKTDSELLAPWSLKKEGKEIFTMPRVAAIRSFVMNHCIHHRGQLTVYMRLKNLPVPSIYGPSADEGAF
jgi:uncharacterized damage-inducible protein DinB